MTKIFLKKENDLRIDKYAKNINEERFLIKMNRSLKCLEKDISDNSDNNIRNIYIFGLPRSGTTLVYQIFTHCLNVAWPTNLMARFWETPVIGMRISKILGLFDKKIEFSSIHGVANQVVGPHEFGYFWMKWMNYKDNIVKGKEHEDTIHWNKLKMKINAISNEVGKPVIYKNILYSFHLERFMQIQKEAIFVYCKRDLMDIATSILKTRVDRYGSKNIWWSFKPLNYKKVIKKDCYEQILYQIEYGNRLFENTIGRLKRGRVMVINYNSINKNIRNIIDNISRKLKVEKKRVILPRFEVSNYKGSKDYIIFKKRFLK